MTDEVERLRASVARAPWFSRATLDPASLRPLDELRAGPTTVTWATVAGARDRTAVLVLAEDDAALLAAVLALTSRPTWRTARGGTVRWHGPPLTDARQGPQLTATATNAVARVAAGRPPAEEDLVLKVYRVLGDGRGEVALLGRLGGRAAPLPEAVGHLEYVAPGGRPRGCLALLTRAAPGVPLDLPLRAALHAHWADAPADREGRRAPVERLLDRVRAALAELHDALAAADPPRPRPLADRLPRLVAAVADLHRILPETTGPRHRLLDRGAALAIRWAEGVHYPAGPAHGDLHLGHVLVDDAGRVRFVDPESAPAPDTGPLDDLAALRRAVECFAADERVARTARQRAYHKHRYATALRRAALAPGTAAGPPRAPGSRWAAA
ncbi:phosphotransferase, partial [Streptomyces mayteni]